MNSIFVNFEEILSRFAEPFLVRKHKNQVQELIRQAEAGAKLDFEFSFDSDVAKQLV
jgi:hypothetical protein